MRSASAPLSTKPALAILLGLMLGLTACLGSPPETAEDPSSATEASPEAKAGAEPDGSKPSDDTPSNAEFSEPERSEIDLQNTASEEADAIATRSEALPSIDSFTTDELFAAGSGGCGMSLWKADTAPRDEGFIFFSGMEGSAMMRLNGDLVTLERDQTTGEEFYGQYTSQTYVAPDDSFSATANVTLGEPGEIESVAIPVGTLLIQAGDAVTKISVEGDAGC